MTPNPLARYETFLIQNSSTINTIESSLRSLTWFLPGRFKDADLASESLTTGLNLLSMYHDALLARRLGEEKIKPLIPPSDLSRYTRAWAERQPSYRHAARTLEIVRFTQLLFEMMLRRRAGKRNTWRGILALEFVKALLRLVILQTTRRPILFPTLPERELDPSSIGEVLSSSKAGPKVLLDRPPTPDHIKNNREIFSPAPPSKLSQVLSHTKTKGVQGVDEFLFSKALTPASVSPPASSIHPLSSVRDWCSELIFILRPLIYAFLVSRPGGEHRDIDPTVVSLSIDLLSRYLRRSPPSHSVIERSEYARRDRDLLRYLLRGSIWHMYSRPKIVGMMNAFEFRPVFNMLSTLVKDWIPIVDEYHYYSST